MTSPEQYVYVLCDGYINGDSIKNPSATTVLGVYRSYNDAMSAMLETVTEAETIEFFRKDIHGVEIRRDDLWIGFEKHVVHRRQKN